MPELAVKAFAALLWAKPWLPKPGALAGMFLACYGASSLIIGFSGPITSRGCRA